MAGATRATIACRSAEPAKAEGLGRGTRVRCDGAILAPRWARHGAGARVGGTARVGRAASNGRHRSSLFVYPHGSPRVRAGAFFETGYHGDFQRTSQSAVVRGLWQTGITGNGPAPEHDGCRISRPGSS